MLESDFWRELAAQFTALSVASHDGLWAHWHHIVKSGMLPEWQLRGGADLAIQFETLAIRGAAVLGNGESTDLLVTWLELLKKELHCFEYGPVGVEKNEDGTEGAHHLMGSIPSLCSTSARMCKELEKRTVQKEFASGQSREESADARLPEPTQVEPSHPLATLRIQPKELWEAYQAQFPEKIVKLDVCWAAGQRYREWKRWMKGNVKQDGKADRAFRAVLNSGKRPNEYRVDQRPAKWK